MHVLSIKVLLNFKYVESNVLFPTLKSQFMYLKFEVHEQKARFNVPKFEVPEYYTI